MTSTMFIPEAVRNALSKKDGSGINTTYLLIAAGVAAYFLFVRKK